MNHFSTELLLFSVSKERVVSLSEQATGHQVGDLGPCHDLFYDNLIEALVRRMWEEQANHNLHGVLFIDSALNTLVAALLAMNGRTSSEPAGRNPLSGSRLQRVLDYIQANLDTDISLAHLAAVVHLSEFHFARLFKASTGQSPHQYVIGLRIERAKELMRSGLDLSLSEIATAVGFYDQSHLNRHFKRVVGVSPSRFQ